MAPLVGGNGRGVGKIIRAKVPITILLEADVASLSQGEAIVQIVPATVSIIEENTLPITGTAKVNRIGFNPE